MQTDRPSSFAAFETHSADEAEDRLGKSLAACRVLDVADRTQFGLRLRAASLGTTSVVYNRYAIRAEVETELVDDSLYVVFGLHAPTLMRSGTTSVWASPEMCVMPEGGRAHRIVRETGSELLALRASRGDLEHHLAALAGRHHRGKLSFDECAPAKQGPAAVLLRTAEYVLTELERSANTALTADLHHALEQVLHTALLDLPHNRSALLEARRHHEVEPRIVRRAEEYMRGHFAERVVIADLLEVCQCSRSTLFGAFRASRGMTPMEFLTEQRLQAARRRLLKPNPGDSVTRAAYTCGFQHAGRFARAYARRFGESPSATLRSHEA